MNIIAESAHRLNRAYNVLTQWAVNQPQRGETAVDYTLGEVAAVATELETIVGGDINTTELLAEALDVVQRALDGGAFENRPNTENLAIAVESKAKRLGLWPSK